MKKRLMSLGLAAVMAMSLTACGNSGSGDGASDSKTARRQAQRERYSCLAESDRLQEPEQLTENP